MVKDNKAVQKAQKQAVCVEAKEKALHLEVQVKAVLVGAKEKGAHGVKYNKRSHTTTRNWPTYSFQGAKITGVDWRAQEVR